MNEDKIKHHNQMVLHLSLGAPVLCQRAPSYA